MDLKNIGGVKGLAPVSKPNESPTPAEPTKPAQSIEPTKTAESPDSPVIDDKVIYTSAPIERLKVGRFQFEKSQLSLSADEAEEFDHLLTKVDARTRSRVKKIDVEAAQRWLKAIRPQATKAIDSSADGVSEKRLVGTEDVLKHNQ